MRVALTDFHHDWGGQALQVLLLARALHARGHAVTVLSPPESELARRAEADGLPHDESCRFPRGFRPRQWWQDLRALKHILREREINLVHAHGSQDTWLAALRKTLGPSVGLVRTKHNSYPVAAHACNRWLYGSAIDRTIAVAESIRQALLEAGVAAPERVVTIHAGLDDNFGKELPAETADAVREEFHIPPAAQLIGLVGRLEPDKGQRVLLHALPRIRESISDAHLLLVGTGGDYDNQRALCRELGIEAHVTFTLFRDDVARLTKACAVALLAATACDASSTVLKEAMRLEVPVVGTDVGGTREILDDGRCGVVIPPNDAEALVCAIIETLAPEHAEETQARVTAARARVEEHYVMSAVAQQTEAVYEAVLRERGQA